MLGSSVAKEPPILDPRQRVLDLRVRAAEETVNAAKLYCKVTHLETVAAKLLIRRLELQEEAEMLTSTGKQHYAKMKEHQEAIAKREDLKATLGPEVIRRRDKAVKYASQASAKEKKMAETEGMIRTALGNAERLRRERDMTLVQARKFEAEAVRAGGPA